MHKLLLVGACILLLGAAPLPPALFPEDGSQRVEVWYFSARVLENNLRADIAWREVYADMYFAFKAEGVEMRDIGYDYDWVQDIALFDKLGNLILMAPMPERSDVLLELTEGVYNDALAKPKLERLSETNAHQLGIPQRSMRYTLVEGGEMISGRFKNGRPYAILRDAVRRRTQAYYAWLHKKPLSSTQATALISRDLGIPATDLIFINLDAHVDLYIQALPGGRVLVQDHKLTLPVLRTLVKRSKEKDEKTRLQAMVKLYSRPHLPQQTTNAVIMPVAYDKAEALSLDVAAIALAKRFSVRRVTGIFREPIRTFPFRVEDRINFLNGVTGRNHRGRVFVVTNRGGNINILHAYWVKVLQAEGVRKQNIHFVGEYNDGAGLDCMGAPARYPRPQARVTPRLRQVNKRRKGA